LFPLSDSGTIWCGIWRLYRSNP